MWNEKVLPCPLLEGTTTIRSVSHSNASSYLSTIIAFCDECVGVSFCSALILIKVMNLVPFARHTFNPSIYI